jgi:hypothetical protein
MIDNVGEERHNFLRADVHDGSCLDPFEELVDCYEKVREAPGCLSERPHHVEVPHGERPCDGDALERLRREVSLSSVELASLAIAHYVLGVCHRGGSVKHLSESLPDKRPWAHTARAGMDLV